MPRGKGKLQHNYFAGMVVLKVILGIVGEKVSIFVLSRYVDDTPESRPSLSTQVPGRLYWGCRAVGTQDQHCLRWKSASDSDFARKSFPTMPSSYHAGHWRDFTDVLSSAHYKRIRYMCTWICLGITVGPSKGAFGYLVISRLAVMYIL